MGKKCLSLFLVSFHLLLLMTCATATIETKVDPDQKITPLKFPEVRIVTTKGDRTTGKLTQFENQTLTFLPYPYWNVDSIKIPLDDIARIELKERKSHAGSRFVAGFSYAFIVVGLLAGFDAKYDEDYEDALAGTAVLGGIAGLIGLAIGAISDSASKKKYEFAAMSTPEKVASLRKIMGAR
jgi:hypothetical protein